jgi:isopenicillin N synthase-like dioxygenase
MLSEIPIIDYTPFLDSPTSQAALDACRLAARAFKEVGVVIVKDPRFDHERGQFVRDETVRFYRQPDEVKRRYIRADTGRNLGWVEPFQESAGKRDEFRALVPPEHAPSVWTDRDPKERWSQPSGKRPEFTEYPEYNVKEPLVPAGFEDWVRESALWASEMIVSCFTAVDMFSIGADMRDPTLLRELLDCGPHLFAPTGCDLSKYGKPGTVIANWHSDMGFMTGHGKSNFPGLRVWTRDNRRIPARVPDGHLILQAGRQFAICTGNQVHPGRHDVVATEDMIPGIERDFDLGLVPWRVSLTEFVHVASDKMLQPYDIFDSPEARAELVAMDEPAQLAGARMRRNLARRNLSAKAAE